ncbi:hypothetical protein BASA81_015514 [Batrachochytrium salamandrivorans]|nr:hypothetical protein BASA81_015514 [Batrachochytrium salamandrivorans]
MTSLYRSVIFLLSVATIQVQGGKDGLDQPELQSGSQSPTQQANYGCFRFNLVRRITRPIRLPQKESKHHLRQEEKEEKYSEFVECESKYLESEYDYVKEPSKNRYGENIQVTTIDSDGSQVLLKTIEKENTVFYKLESTPPPKTHMAEIGNEDGRYTSRECKLPEPFNLMLPYEIEMQKHLTQPDYGSPYVLEVVDYAVTKKEYVLVMKYPGKDWIALDRYMREEGKRSVYETSKLKLMNFDHSGLLEEWNQGSSASGSSGTNLMLGYRRNRSRVLEN